MVRHAIAGCLALCATLVLADPPAARRPAAAPAATAPDDGLERFAQRLAARLGARGSAGPDGSVVLRVPARDREPVAATAPRAAELSTRPSACAASAAC